MQVEPTEIRMMVNAFRCGVRRGQRPRPAAPAAIEPTAADALDAAFDEYTRIDAGTPTFAAPRERQAMTRSLITDITAQLDILDWQRQQLAALLANVKC